MSTDVHECPACGEDSDKIYRCTECGHDLAGDTTTVGQHE